MQRSLAHPWAAVVTSVTLIRSRSSYKHTYKHAYLCVYVYIYMFFCVCVFLIIPDSWLPNSLVLLDTGIFHCPTTSCRPCRQAFLPDFHRFGECVCFSWMCTECCGWVKVLNVCECVYVWVYMTAVWPNIQCLLHMERTSGLYHSRCARALVFACVYKHECTRTYMYRQTERHSGWISYIEYNRLPRPYHVITAWQSMNLFRLNTLSFTLTRSACVRARTLTL